MPTQTFFNLPAEKRERIVDAAIEELARYPYRNISIARIIEAAGIPRGSFYQYFADIKDLYRYVMNLIGEKKMGFMQQMMAQIHQLGTFQTLRELYFVGLQFAREHPGLAAVGNQFFKEDESIKREIFGDFEDKSNDFIVGLIRKGQVTGDVNPEIDPEIAAFMFFNLNVAFVDFYLSRSKLENIFDDAEDFLQMFDKMLYILENGLKQR